MKTRLIKIGNSRGIRIPKTVLEQLNLTEEVELDIQHDQLVIRSATSVRQNWDEQFRLMAEQGDDQLLDQPEGSLTDWDNEWEW